ncbi:MAG: hypothetical protein HOP29_13655 [Phycisphaerales bacterium]|nr:hypothetical protein [Phycisphaerales bacterium]
MHQHVIIDGNNLLHAAHARGPRQPIGRETLVRRIESWAKGHRSAVTIVFDGPSPRPGLARQMTSGPVTVLFSAPESADDVIIRMIRDEFRRAALRIVTGDTAIAYEARNCRCAHVDATAFVDELMPDRADAARRATGATSSPDDDRNPARATAARDDKPPPPTADESREWLDLFGLSDGGDV